MDTDRAQRQIGIVGSTYSEADGQERGFALDTHNVPKRQPEQLIAELDPRRQ